jgi:hypothetical protein
MTKLNRRAFLQYLVATGAVGTATWLGYQRWQTETIPSPLPTDEPATAINSDSQAPILLLTNSAANPFGPYLAEILRAEGLNLFQMAEAQTLEEGQLSRFALVLLAEGPLTEQQVGWLTDYVAEGGRLIAMRPDAALTTLAGVELETGVTTEGYLRIEAAHPSGRGLATETLQFHGQANHYRPVDTSVIAWLYSDVPTPTELPAVTLRQHGAGWVALWAFDLARSIAYTRQGNPLWVQQERDGADGIRAHDAFVDWIDLERLAVPQADEQMRLLSGLIREMLAEVLPLPRLWYFPNASQAMLIVTGDSHANPTENIEALLSLVEAHQGTMSVYFTPPARSENSLRRSAGLAVQQIENWFNPFPRDSDHLPTPAEIEAWRARGHEFSLHPYVESGVAEGYAGYVAAFKAEGYDLPVDSTVRTHRILWSGWVETAKAQAANGFGLNVDFYQIGPTFKTADGRWVHGYFTGSGLPMKMVDETGQIIDVYQVLTELIDEQLLKDVNSGWEKLDPAAAIAVSRTMIDNALHYHTALATQFHLDFYHPTSPVRVQVEAWAKGTLDYAAEKGLLIWSAARLLNFVRCRNAAQLNNLRWDQAEQHLSFQLQAAENEAFELTIVIPATVRQESHLGKISHVQIDGRPATFTLQPSSDDSNAWVSLPPGRHTLEVWYIQA